jgi:hypothetical protein
MIEGYFAENSFHKVAERPAPSRPDVDLKAAMAELLALRAMVAEAERQAMVALS